MPLVRDRLSISELALPVSIWSSISDEQEVAGTPLVDEWLHPHRIDVLETCELRKVDPSRLGARYFVTSRSSDEEHFHFVLADLAGAQHVALGTMLLGNDAVSVMLQPAGAAFELYPVLTRPKSAQRLPLGTLRVATIHMATRALARLREAPAESHADDRRAPADAPPEVAQRR